MSDIPILLLAAGSSSRMRGRDKLMEEVDGVPLIARAAGIARAATEGAVIVTLPPAPHPRYGALTGVDVATVPVPDAAEGMAASIRAGLAHVPKRAKAVMILLADLPDLTSDDLRAVLRAVEEHPEKKVWRGVTMENQPGHPIVFAAPLFPELAALRGDEGGRAVVAACGNELCRVRLPGAHARADLDTPEAWAAWRAARDR